MSVFQWALVADGFLANGSSRIVAKVGKEAVNGEFSIPVDRASLETGPILSSCEPGHTSPK